MSRIKILPEILSNKIAAGEVVERPASVVKELVENSIDAESERILIEVETGGKSLIRVSDNGSGMSRDDALLAIERHATSKIASESDLEQISTLGFRGEALPSIAAVSRFTMVTRPDASESATKIYIEGGRLKSVKETGAPPGTMIEVRNLFFNTPGRRKFLKTTSTEIGHIVDVVVRAALARPEIRIRLLHNGRVSRDFLPVSDPADRVADVLGSDIRPLLHQIKRPGASVSVSGWIVDPAVDHGAMNRIFVFVNGRHVRDRGVVHALVSGCAGRIMKGRFPLAVLYIEVPFDQVDVNVHPAKHEVRFARPSEVHESVRSAVASSLRDSAAPTVGDVAEKQASEEEEPFLYAKVPGDNHSRRIVEPDIFHDRPNPARIENIEDIKERPAQWDAAKETFEKTDKGVCSTAPNVRSSVWDRPRLADAVLIGQFKNTYILCEISDELVFIDQHAAHERILYEQLKQKLDSKGIAVQKLLMPETIELGASESALIQEMIPDLRSLGLDIEHFGDETFVVKAVPEIISDREIRPLLIEFAAEAEGKGYTPGLSEVLDRLLILMACHGAIRANQRLSDAGMRSLISQLLSCENPFNCPHGRPTISRWPLRSIEKAFKRIV